MTSSIPVDGARASPASKKELDPTTRPVQIRPVTSPVMT